MKQKTMEIFDFQGSLWEQSKIFKLHKKFDVQKLKINKNKIRGDFL